MNEISMQWLANKLKPLLCACGMLAFSLAGVHAKELAGIKATPILAEVGEPVQVAIGLRPMNNVNVCGLQVDFGDGSTGYIRVQEGSLSLTVQHTYRQPGFSVIKVAGQTKFQGINTTFACSGGAKTAGVRVLPQGTAARRAAGEAERQAVLQRAQEEVQSAKAATAEAQRQRDAAELTARRALSDKAMAEKRARDSAEQRTAAQRQAEAARANASARAAPAAESAPKSKPDQPKPKSSLDL